MVLMCRMKGKSVTIISNGTSAEESDYNLLSDFKISLFEFPLHSENAVIHDKMAGKEGSFKKVLQSIRYLQRLNTDICVVCVLTKLNIELLRETLVFAESIGIKKFMLARFNIGGRGIEHQEELLPSLQQLKSAFQTANDFSMNSSMQISANVCVPCCIIDQKDYPGIAISHCSSDPMRKPITIDAFGDVRMCNHSPVITGNIFRESIRSIFNSEYVKSWDTTTPLYCRDCVKWEKCRGGCRAASEQLGGSLLAEDPIVGLMKLVDQGADPTPLLSSPSTL